MYRDHRIAALVPAFNEAPFIAGVISTMPEYVDAIIVIDDASTDGTSEAAGSVGDSRVTVTRHESNQGLGAALISGHLLAIADDADITVIMAGDGQMPSEHLTRLLDPIIDDRAEFTKGNRFYSPESMRGMPRHRIFGNIVLTFLTKAATGYWNLVDPQNGYTAMAADVQQRIDWPAVARDYSFENDVIARLGMQRARIVDVDIPAVYGEEISDIRLSVVVPDILRTLRRAFWRRVWYQYVLRSFSPVAVLASSGALLLLWALLFGAWVIASSIGAAEATTATVMLAALPFLMGFMLLLAAWVLDIYNSPS